MKAVVYEKYGAPDVLELREIEKPVPQDNEILVKVYATTVTAGDWRMRKADPFLVRIVNGIFKPSRTKILGFELAGVVEEAGKDVKTFKRGDSVFAFCGFKFGAYAEYKCLPIDQRLALKPSNMTFEEAAAVPIGALTALQFLKSAGVKKGNQVLIYGASGSVGTFAIQIARYYGATVTAVCSTANVDLVKSLGADQVIDYTKEDFTKLDSKFDIVFDAVGKTSKSACKNLLKPDAKYISVTGQPKANPDDMQVLKEMIEAGKLKAVIDRKYTLGQIREAHTYVESFRKKGNVVVSVSERSSALTA
ncbi:NAD(P)-dependent alcohol dehydrogenase [Fulvivirgaceae bacterium PWU4]|uniref:NAD(P)-dependent alcohol dehydrogenase n=1 Tax=Chryseosolibacter histidini TaxID=2782349 RepID=A0AAP2DRV0_9BACT|nr:NAD(P)-dependent alcohol dehydrogenase [Chryseosolibacter histidini]MBT1701330.1 NAD(P)-dependent alcohol dehydrogenase [Chryseosolibacter histidini]